MNWKAIQQAVKETGNDGWLFYDFHNRDSIAYRILGLDSRRMSTRRWFYYIPAEGQPVKLVHAIEAGRLDELSGVKVTYRGWKELHAKLKGILLGEAPSRGGRVFMQYSPLGQVPTVSLADAGTVELLRSWGIEVLSSADLVQRFGTVLDAEDFESHRRAGAAIHRILKEIPGFIRRRLDQGNDVNEMDINRLIQERFSEYGLTADGMIPMVGLNEHAADPHFDNRPENAWSVKDGDRLLIDLWAREDKPDSIYYDVSWCFFIGQNPDDEYRRRFALVRDARKAVKAFIEERIAAGETPKGWEADDICRGIIDEAGFGEAFPHRTGHSIGNSVHGEGVNLDNLETKEERSIIPGTCFSVEPGVYRDGIGVRSEIDICVLPDGRVEVAGPEQEEIVTI